MSGTASTSSVRADRARAWRHAFHAGVCDSIEPWAHGTVVRASPYPTYYDLNVVRVEDDPGLSAEELTGFAGEALAGLEHRRLDFEEEGAARSSRAALSALGWKSTRLLWMRHERALPRAGREIEVCEVPYEAVDELRTAWYLEDSDGSEYERFSIAAREVAESRDVRVLAVEERGSPIAFAQLERVGRAAEITQVYVRGDRRGAGRGTAMTRAAVLAAGDVDDLWIVADDEDRPKQLYARLGFVPAWSPMECLLLP